MPKPTLSESPQISPTIKKPSFWLFQIGGWLAYIVVAFVENAVFFGRFKDDYLTLVLSLFGTALIGFVATLFMRSLYRRCWHLSNITLFSVILVTSLIAALLVTILKNLFAWGVMGDWHTLIAEINDPKFSYFTMFMYASLSLYTLTAWSGLYFGINYHYRLLQEKEQHLQSARLSHHAQIKMLRYQINPHFLFNTLNAISTLVLRGAKSEANTMLTQLSTFLRFSLDSDPEQRITVDDEIKALMLYLDIEKTRFQDRLHIELDIQENVKDALVPSLILQPVVENAIKYAITKIKKDGVIAIKAHRNQDKLIMQIEDNGPITSLAEIDMSQGIGLQNIQQRLIVLYGDSQQCIVSTCVPNGFSVELQLPFEQQ